MSRVFLRGCAPSSACDCDGRADRHARGGAALLGWWQPGVLLLRFGVAGGVVRSSEEVVPRERERERDLGEP